MLKIFLGAGEREEKQMALTQRPLSIGEILDRTVQIYRRNFLPLVSITAPPAAALVLFFGAFGIFFAKTMFSAVPFGPNAPATPAFQDIASILIMGAALFFVGIPFMVAVIALSLGAANHAVLCAHRDEQITIRASYSFAFKHFWRYVWLLSLQALFSFIIPGFVIGMVISVLLVVAAVVGQLDGGVVPVIMRLLVILLYIAMVVAFVWMWLRYSLAFPASVAEEKTAWASMKRSVPLSKGSRGRIFVMFLLVWIITVAVSLILAAPVDIGLAFFFRKSITPGRSPAMLAIGMQVVNLCIDFVVRTLVTPVYATAIMLFYFDQRTRQEGYDIELLMAQAGWAELVAPAPTEAAAPWPGVEPTAVADFPAGNRAEHSPEISEPEEQTDFRRE